MKSANAKYHASKLQMKSLIQSLRPFSLFILCVFLWLFSSEKLAAQDWTSLPFQLDVPARCLFEDTTSDRLYVAGNFREVDGYSVQGILSYDGSQWDSLGHKISIFPILCMTKYGGKLIVGGYGGIASWNGFFWEEFLLNGAVWSMIPYKSRLLLGGNFEVVGADTLRGLAIYDGNELSRVFGAEFFSQYSSPRSSKLISYQNTIYAAGSFVRNGRNCLLLKWNGRSWEERYNDFGGGGSSWINDMEVFQGELYVGGHFSLQAGNPGNQIARWNGQRWDNVGSGMGSDGQLMDLAVFDNSIWACGSFGSINGLPTSFLTKFDGTQWCTLGSQFDNSLGALSSFRNELYLAGAFRTIDNDSIRFAAKWVGEDNVDTCSIVPVHTADPASGDAAFVSLYPNPTTTAFTLTLPQNISSAQIQIRDPQGRAVAPSQAYTGMPVDVSALARGLYFVEVSWRGGRAVLKVIRE